MTPDTGFTYFFVTEVLMYKYESQTQFSHRNKFIMTRSSFRVVSIIVTKLTKVGVSGVYLCKVSGVNENIKGFSLPVKRLVNWLIRFDFDSFISNIYIAPLQENYSEMLEVK